jgi:arylsulfatase A-like enzyme
MESRSSPAQSHHNAIRRAVEAPMMKMDIWKSMFENFTSGHRMGRVLIGLWASTLVRSASSLVRSAFALSFAFLSSCHSEPLEPNVVLISLDTVRADQLSFYGYARDTSPALAAFAAQGATFENAYAQAPNTVPTHASMFTGRYPFEHNMYLHGETLAPGEITLAEILAGHGYRTFGLTSSMRFVPEAGYDQGFDVYENVDDLPKNERADRVTDRALELARLPAAQPYFAFLHYFGAHAPYAAPEPYRSLWHPGLAVPTPETTVSFMAEYRWPEQELDPDVIDYLRALYDAGIRHQDEALGRLFEGLLRQGGSRPTLIVVTSDHGEEFKEHGYLMHSQFLHEELVRVPLVVYWADQVAAGRRIAIPTQSVDLAPTILGLLGLPHWGAFSGRSLAPWLLDPGHAPDDSDRYPKDVVVLEASPSWGIIATLETGRFKWVEGRGQGLFRLDEDPTADVEVSAQYQEESVRLMDLARELGLPEAVRLRSIGLRNRNTTPPGAKRAALDAREEELRARLQALGYLEEAHGEQ